MNRCSFDCWRVRIRTNFRTRSVPDCTVIEYQLSVSVFENFEGDFWVGLGENASNRVGPFEDGEGVGVGEGFGEVFGHEAGVVEAVKIVMDE